MTYVTTKHQTLSQYLIIDVSLYYSMLQAAFVSFALGLLVSTAAIVGEIKVVRRREKNNERPVTLSTESGRTTAVQP